MEGSSRAVQGLAVGGSVEHTAQAAQVSWSRLLPPMEDTCFHCRRVQTPLITLLWALSRDMDASLMSRLLKWIIHAQPLAEAGSLVFSLLGSRQIPQRPRFINVVLPADKP